MANRKKLNSYWAGMSKEERSKEMTRRAKIGKRNGHLKVKHKKLITCPACQLKIGENNIHRHMKAKHGLTKRQTIRALSTGIMPDKEPQVTHERNGKTPQTTADVSSHVAYLWGKTETLIEHYCDSAGVSRQDVTNGLASILHSKEGRKVVGA